MAKGTTTLTEVPVVQRHATAHHKTASAGRQLRRTKRHYQAPPNAYNAMAYYGIPRDSTGALAPSIL
eukprot:scaffold66137_cov18-Tisochrysis_lutea.AAC.1